MSEKEKQERARDKEKEERLKLLNELTLLKTAFSKRLEEFLDIGVNQILDSEKKELEEMGYNVDGILQEIEPEMLEVAKLYAEFYIRRYEEEGKKLKETDPQKLERQVKRGRYNPDGTLPEKRKLEEFCMGITQKAFEITLQQLQIPYVPNDPTIDWRPLEDRGKDDPLDKSTKFRYDFYIPFFGKIDIKSATLAHGWNNVNVNCDTFDKENPDYVVAYKILGNIKKLKWLKLLGFMTNDEVRKYDPITRTGRPFWSIPIKDFETKHDAKQLLDKLLFVRVIIKESENPRHA